MTRDVVEYVLRVAVRRLRQALHGGPSAVAFRGKAAPKLAIRPRFVSRVGHADSDKSADVLA